MAKDSRKYSPCFLLLPALALSGSIHSQTAPELVLNPGTPEELRLELSSQSSVEIDPETGGLQVSSVTVPDLGTGGEVSVAPFSPSPSVVEQGQTFEVTVDTRGAWSCSRSGLPDSEWLESDAEPVNEVVSVRVDTSVAADVYTLQLECENGGTVASESAVLEVTEPPEPDPDLPADCGNVPLPAAWSRDTTALAGDRFTSTLTWRDVYGNDFPSGSSENIGVDEDQFMALEFDPSTLRAGAQGSITFNSFASQPGGDIGNGTPTVSISRCPGDFREPVSDAPCRRVNGTSINWTTDPADGSRCSLDTSQTRYFINVVYAYERDESDPSTWFYSCPDSSDPDRQNFPECGSLMTSSSNQ